MALTNPGLDDSLYDLSDRLSWSCSTRELRYFDPAVLFTFTGSDDSSSPCFAHGTLDLRSVSRPLGRLRSNEAKYTVIRRGGKRPIRVRWSEMLKDPRKWAPPAEFSTWTPVKLEPGNWEEIMRREEAADEEVEEEYDDDGRRPNGKQGKKKLKRTDRTRWKRRSKAEMARLDADDDDGTEPIPKPEAEVEEKATDVPIHPISPPAPSSPPPPTSPTTKKKQVTRTHQAQTHPRATARRIFNSLEYMNRCNSISSRRCRCHWCRGLEEESMTKRKGILARYVGCEYQDYVDNEKNNRQAVDFGRVWLCSCDICQKREFLMGVAGEEDGMWSDEKAQRRDREVWAAVVDRAVKVREEKVKRWVEGLGWEVCSETDSEGSIGDLSVWEEDDGEEDAAINADGEADSEEWEEL